MKFLIHFCYKTPLSASIKIGNKEIVKLLATWKKTDVNLFCILIDFLKYSFISLIF